MTSSQNGYSLHSFINISDSPEKLTDDYEIQNWGHMLADPEDGLGIKVPLILRRFQKFSQVITELQLSHSKSTVELFFWFLKGDTLLCVLQGVFGGGKFTDLEDLIKAVTTIIFISSVGHSAANFAQYDEYAFPPNYPAFLRGKPPTSKVILRLQSVSILGMVA